MAKPYAGGVRRGRRWPGGSGPRPNWVVPGWPGRPETTRNTARSYAGANWVVPGWPGRPQTTRNTAGLASAPMRRVLVTGMSGTGKSTALAELERRGFQVVDTDVGGWSEWSEADGGYVWREDRIAELLSREEGPALYVSGTVSNQGRFYPCFDAVVLLSAPAEVLLRRIERRSTNDYGKTTEQRAAILSDLAEVEPLLRASCTRELDATQPISRVVDQLVEIGAGEAASREPRARGRRA